MLLAGNDVTELRVFSVIFSVYPYIVSTLKKGDTTNYEQYEVDAMVAELCHRFKTPPEGLVGEAKTIEMKMLSEQEKRGPCHNETSASASRCS